MRGTRVLSILAMLAGLALAAGGCGDSTSTNPPPGFGTLQVSLTDGPINMAQVSNLFVTFDRLSVGAPEDSLPSDSTGHQTFLFTTPITLDLLALGNGLTEALGSANLRDGDYHSFTLDISNAWLIEADGDSFDVFIPSHRIKVITNFSVTAGLVTDIVLDFNAAASLHQTGNGQYILRPVIHQLPARQFGASISGTVFVQTDSGLVNAGDFMVSNPWVTTSGMDHGNGNRPGDRHGRGRHRDLRPTVPLTVAWPMIVHAIAQGDSTDDAGDDTTGVDTDLNAMRGASMLESHDEGMEQPRSRGTMVGVDGNYILWRLRKGGTYDVRLFLNSRSGFEVVSGPPVIMNLLGDLTGQNFVIRRKLLGTP